MVPLLHGLWVKASKLLEWERSSYSQYIAHATIFGTSSSHGLISFSISRANHHHPRGSWDRRNVQSDCDFSAPCMLGCCFQITIPNRYVWPSKENLKCWHDDVPNHVNHPSWVFVEFHGHDQPPFVVFPSSIPSP